MTLPELLRANEMYGDSYRAIDSPRPSKHLAVVTCMDARIDVFASLGLQLGQAHIIRNAGARVTDDIIRSLTVSSHALGVTSLLLLQHTNCGLALFNQNELEEMTGSDMDFCAIADHHRSIADDIKKLKAAPSLSLIKSMTGAIFHVDTGRLEVLIK